MTDTIKYALIILPIVTYILGIFLGRALERRKHTRLNLLTLLKYFSKYNTGHRRAALVMIDQKVAIGIPKGDQHFTVTIDDDDYKRTVEDVAEEIETEYEKTHEIVLDLLNAGSI